MHSQKVANVKGLYLEGIRDGNARAALDKYIGERYTQHSTGVADGKEGFLAFFEPFLERNPVRDIQIVRAIEDGQFVFVQAYQSLNHGEAEWVTADLFDTNDDDKIIEHWDVIQEYVGQTASGRTMVDGVVAVEDLEQTEENKRLVRSFAEVVLLGGLFEKAGEYISSEVYHEHSPLAGDGLDGFLAHKRHMKESGRPIRYQSIERLIGQGNFVVLYSDVLIGEEEHAVFDIFRLRGGMIVEHWDAQEKISPKEQWNNSGKF